MGTEYRGLTKGLPVLDESAFLSQFAIVGDCWEWQGKRNEDGYGLTNMQGTTEKLTHRIMYSLVWGPIPYPMLVRHRCDNPSCGNPDHLELGTLSDNAQDRERRGRGGWRKRHA